MNRRIALATAACAVFASCTLFGCGSEPEVPSVASDIDSDTALVGGYTVTDESKLQALAVGETAVWRDYEATVASIERADGRLVVNLQVKSHGLPQTLETGCLLSFGMPPAESSFDGGVIEVAADGTASGTLTFDDQYGSERLFWNDGATEATWDLTLPAVQAGQTGQQQGAEEPEAAKPEEPKKDEVSEEQKTAIAALEAEIPSLFANNTLYTYQSVDPATATVTPQEGGGYEYVNDVSILDGAGSTTTANVRLICEPNGNCISMTVDGAFLF
ncbi:hypothetical protein [Arabiibacter massiliensis]|uniref:hypothetical protein n=1 Tax=Arabiibacter massiliensis TaxID=1870985 RepID=UPI0009BC2D94|nr:hypothetical protein [Arabiibacter massiliensis]